MFQSKITPGSVMINFDNNHRIMCVDASGPAPEYVGFIGKELVRESMPMRIAVRWLNAKPENHDTVCPICKNALFKYSSVIAAEGQLFCSTECAREWKTKIMHEQMKKDLDVWVNEMCEEVDTESIGIRDKEDIYNG